MKTNEKIEALRNATCEYILIDHETGQPKPCGDKQMMTCSLPVLRQMENGQLKADEGIQIGLPFCKKHFFLAMNGHFGILEKDGQQSLHGPFETVDLCKSVIQSMIMTGELQESIKASEEAKEALKDSEKKT